MSDVLWKLDPWTISSRKRAKSYPGKPLVAAHNEAGAEVV